MGMCLGLEYYEQSPQFVIVHNPPCQPISFGTADSVHVMSLASLMIAGELNLERAGGYPSVSICLVLYPTAFWAP